MCRIYGRRGRGDARTERKLRGRKGKAEGDKGRRMVKGRRGGKEVKRGKRKGNKDRLCS